MVISHHHILYDGWSTGLILKEFFRAYHELYQGNIPLKPPVKTKFKEFVKWILQQDKGKQEIYWKEYLQGVNAQTEIPVKKKRAKPGAAQPCGIIPCASPRDCTRRSRPLSRTIKSHWPPCLYLLGDFIAGV